MYLLLFPTTKKIVCFADHELDFMEVSYYGCKNIIIIIIIIVIITIVIITIVIITIVIVVIIIIIVIVIVIIIASPSNVATLSLCTVLLL